MLRREFVLATSAMMVTNPTLVACSTSETEEDAARYLRRPMTAHNGNRTMLQHELVRYVTLAPSSHNTQCWKFRVQDTSITIEPDLWRRCPVVDPDDHHLFVSLGCATENLVHAARANGFHAEADFDPADAGAVSVSLAATKAQVSPLFRAIAERQCTRGDYDGKPLPLEELGLLEQAGRGNGVRIVLLTERSAIERVLELSSPGTPRKWLIAHSSKS